MTESLDVLLTKQATALFGPGARVVKQARGSLTLNGPETIEAYFARHPDHGALFLGGSFDAAWHALALMTRAKEREKAPAKGGLDGA